MEIWESVRFSFFSSHNHCFSFPKKFFLIKTKKPGFALTKQNTILKIKNIIINNFKHLWPIFMNIKTSFFYVAKFLRFLKSKFGSVRVFSTSVR